MLKSTIKKMSILGFGLLVGSTLLVGCNTTNGEQDSIDNELNDLRTKYNLTQTKDVEKKESSAAKQSKDESESSKKEAESKEDNKDTVESQTSTSDDSTSFDDSSEKSETKDTFDSIDGKNVKTTVLSEEDGKKHFSTTLQNGMELFDKIGYVIGQDKTILVSLRGEENSTLGIKVVGSKLASDGTLYVKVSNDAKLGTGVGFVQYDNDDIKQIKVIYNGETLTEYTESNFF